MAFQLLLKGTVDLSSWSLPIGFFSLFLLFSKILSFSSLSGACLHLTVPTLSRLCSEHNCSPTQQAINQKSREMCSCCSLTPGPWNNHHILLELSLKNWWLQIPPLIYRLDFFLLKFKAAGTEVSTMFPPLKRIYTSLAFYLMKDLHSMKK